MNRTEFFYKQITKNSDVKYITFKLYMSYTFICVFFVALGLIISNLQKDSISWLIFPGATFNRLSLVGNLKNFNFISTIIYNSIDIFKISIIIIIAGFTYISRVISRVTTALWSTWCGFTLYYYINIWHNSVVLITVMSLFLLIYFAIFISNCVRTELVSQVFSKYSNPGTLLTSNLFWKHIENFLISFGYILILYTFCILLVKLLM